MILIDTDHATYLKYPESEPGRHLIERKSSEIRSRGRSNRHG
jgi:hypothetical protein